ncbi:uncharacterized protein LOC129600040 [Paramacrobiotus metropolitanus]|uniref:uncharacterized protein LOC129600040 n=1 Tax=Paramacrobiotus metropolitanus TaxID=2943436 RepID=UPI002445A64E|nr:uncharacterized protein LOC129600040 [Paramacrobiotus metropolitanus]
MSSPTFADSKPPTMAPPPPTAKRVVPATAFPPTGGMKANMTVAPPRTAGQAITKAAPSSDGKASQQRRLHLPRTAKQAFNHGHILLRRPHITCNYARIVSNSAVPLTNTFAEIQWLPASYYSSSDGGNTYTCQYDHWIGTVGRDGSQIGIDYNSETNPSYAPNPQSTMAIKYDYRKYSIDYGCSSPNLKTGICASPIVFVSTRVRPTQLSYHEKREIDRVVDAVFAPYCRSADDIPLQQYDDNKPDCSLPLQPQDCANSTLRVMGINTDLLIGLTLEDP